MISQRGVLRTGTFLRITQVAALYLLPGDFLSKYPSAVWQGFFEIRCFWQKIDYFQYKLALVLLWMLRLPWRGIDNLLCLPFRLYQQSRQSKPALGLFLPRHP